MKTRKFRKTLLFVLIVAIVSSLISTQTFTVKAYNINNAVSFAKQHAQYDIDHLGAGSGKYGSSYCSNGWLCAGFVSACLGKGGIEIPNYGYYSSTKQSYNSIGGSLGNYTNPYTCSEALLVYLYENGYKIISDPQNSDIDIGDVVFLYGSNRGINGRDDHVGICVDKSDNGNVYYAAHNSCTASTALSANYPCTYVAKMNGASGATSIPAAVTNLSTDKKVYTSNEFIHFTWDAADGAETYWVYLWKDGTQLYSYECGNKTSFTQAPSGSGKYTLVIRPGNSYGFNESSVPVSYVVTNDIPEAVTNLHSDKNVYSTSEAVFFQWDEAYGADTYWVYLWKDGTQLYSYNCGEKNHFTQAPSTEGKYTLCIRPGNANGYNESSKSYTYYVTDSVPAPVTNLKSEKSLYTTSETINFTWSISETAQEYWVYIWKEDEQIHSVNCGSNAYFSLSQLDEGSYAIIVEPKNLNGYGELTQYNFIVNDGYSIVYNTERFNNTFNQQTKIYNTDIQLSSEIPTRENYIFKCWNTSANGDGSNYYPGEIYKLNQNLTLYAIWESATLNLINDNLHIDTESNIIFGSELIGMTKSELEKQFSNETLKITMVCEERVATGTIIEITDIQNNVTDKLTVVIFGDIDGNGWYDANDAFILNMINAGLIVPNKINNAAFIAADCNHDGVVDELDFKLISNASILLDNINQSASYTELENNSVFISYCSIIEQNYKTETEKVEYINNKAEESNENILTILFNFINFIIDLVFKIFIINQ
ncbi:MAG: InlB B-repeat-containing protein [Clostridia bacterium]|nr:InlB B-repeat-containing protein [Clostridia bacterium]